MGRQKKASKACVPKSCTTELCLCPFSFMYRRALSRQKWDFATTLFSDLRIAAWEEGERPRNTRSDYRPKKKKTKGGERESPSVFLPTFLFSRVRVFPWPPPAIPPSRSTPVVCINSFSALLFPPNMRRGGGLLSRPSGSKRAQGLSESFSLRVSAAGR